MKMRPFLILHLMVGCALAQTDSSTILATNHTSRFKESLKDVRTLGLFKSDRRQ